MKLKELLIGASLFVLAQSLSWYQTNGQFISDWMKQHPIIVAAIMGVPIGVSYIYGTTFVVSAFEGHLWPSRLVGFATGIVSFTLLTYLHLREGINLKTAVILALAVIILILQVFWKVQK